MLKLKAPLIIAGATCVLSMLIGLISGVRFLNILGRGLIAGVGAGGFVLCARIILERFIPDLFTPLSATSPETADMTDVSSGANINITLDDDLAAPDGASDSAGLDGMSNTAEVPPETQNTEAVHADAPSGDSAANDGHEDAVSEFSAAPPLSFNDDVQDDDLSDLPNVDSLIDTNSDFNENIDDGMQVDSGGFSMTGIQTDGTDSKVMAQAIRTVLATED